MTGFHLEKWARGDKTIFMKNMGVGGKGSVRDSAPSRGVWRHFEFIPSDAFSDLFVVLKRHDEMTRFLVLI